MDNIKQKKSVLFCYFDTCFMYNIGQVSDWWWHDSLAMYCRWLAIFPLENSPREGSIPVDSPWKIPHHEYTSRPFSPHWKFHTGKFHTRTFPPGKFPTRDFSPRNFPPQNFPPRKFPQISVQQLSRTSKEKKSRDSEWWNFRLA